MSGDFQGLISHLRRRGGNIPEGLEDAPAPEPKAVSEAFEARIPKSGHIGQSYSSKLAGSVAQKRRAGRQRPLLWAFTALLVAGSAAVVVIGPENVTTFWADIVGVFKRSEGPAPVGGPVSIIPETLPLEPPLPEPRSGEPIPSDVMTSEPAADSGPENSAPPVDADLKAWETARANGRLSALRGYIIAFPAGAYHKAALAASQTRMKGLRVPGSPSSVVLRRQIMVQELPGKNEASAIYGAIGETTPVLVIDAPNAGRWYLFAGEGSWPFRFAPEADVVAASADVIQAARRLRDDSRLDNFYPERARTSGKEGSVRVSLTISDVGKVTHSQVVSEDPRGWGFGDAATRLTLSWRYEPARKNGVAQSTTVEETIYFDLKSVR